MSSPVATPFELGADLPDSIKAAIQAEIRQTMTALPVIVSTSDQHTTKAHSAIHGIVRQPDGTTHIVPLPEFQTMPVHFAGGGKVVSTHPVKGQDEGILIFAARAIDTWLQSGGNQPPIDARQHHASDGFYLGTVKSDPNKIPNKAPDSIHHRSIDGKVTHEVHPDNGCTTKVVPQSDPSTNPFQSAQTFYQTIHNAVSGLAHSAVASGVTHLMSLTHAAGALIQAANAAHSFNVHPSSGLVSQTTASILANAAQNITHTAGQNLSQSAGQVLSLTAGTAIGLSAPSLSLPSGGVAAGALAPGAAASNVGALGGDLSGTLPNPNVVGAHTIPAYASNAAAISGGLAVGKLYVNTSIFGGEYVVCVVH